MSIFEYNIAQARKLEAERLPPIQEIRWCLISGGVYRHPGVTNIEIVDATLQGIQAGPHASLKITFLFDGDSFKLAYQNQDAAGSRAAA